MSTPLGEKTLAAVPIPLDRLTAHLDPGYEGFESGQRHRAKRWPAAGTFGPVRGIDPVQPDQLIGDNDGVAVDDLGATGQAIGTQ
jgi:hypothetical protein